MMRATVVTPQQAENYYRQENYYSKKESKQNSEWYGKGADKRCCEKKKIIKLNYYFQEFV